MDPEICKSITKIIGRISTSGTTKVDSKLVKDLIYYAGKSENFLKFTHERLMKQLKKKHSQIRLGVLLIINEFFKKSSFYRELFLDDFRTILDLTVGSDKSKPLPPPTDAAEKLKLRVLEFFQKWHNKFSATHHRIPIAYNYIKNVLKIDFGDSLKRNLDQLAEADRAQEREERAKSTNFEKLQAEIREHESDILELVTEMRSCFSLIIPKPEEFLGDTGKDGDCDKKNQKDLDIREHGLTAQTTIIIEFNPNARAKIEQNEDNEAVIETVKGLYSRAKNRFYPLLRKWTQLASKIGKENTLRKVVDLKDMLCSEMTRFEELHLAPTSAVRLDDSIEDDDSDENSSDFEEVQEKEGYEDFAVAPHVIPKPVEISQEQLWETKDLLESAVACGSKSSASYSMSQLSQPIYMEECHDPTYGVNANELKAGILSSKSVPKTFNQTKNTVDEVIDARTDRKSKLLAVAPKLPFDIDLYHWEDKDLKAPAIEIADTGMHRFWQPIDREGESIENPNGVSAFRTRKIEFSGTFEPIQWSCRAPLPSGKLCPRKDREKCPLHGKVIARDESGNPTKPEDVARLKEETDKAEKNKVPDWQDPKFLKELQAKIGIDLTIRPSKKGGKSFAEKYPKLTDVRRLQDTPRSRLEKKIFSKKSLKRVADAVDSTNQKRFKDKFGDQFNYTDS